MRAKFSNVSPSGIEEARPEVRVRITDCATPGNVSSAPRTAAAAAKDGTPGVTFALETLVGATAAYFREREAELLR